MRRRLSQPSPAAPVILQRGSGVLQSGSTLGASFANTVSDALVGIVNDLRIQEDGWMHLAPYGDFPGKVLLSQPDGTVKTEPAIQRLDRQAVADMVNEFHSLAGSARRFLRGRKLYVGHPDAPGIGNEYADKEPRGIFTALEARDDGLYGKPVLTEEGAAAIESKAFTSVSAYWLANEVSPEAPSGSKPIFRPTVFRSAGLTNRPNLPVRHLTNEGVPDGTADQPQPNSIMDKSKLIPWLAKHGVSLANDATDEQVLAGLDQVDSKLASVANERDTVKTELAAKDAVMVRINGQLAEQQSAFTNERKARIEGALDSAITAGRIAPADRPVWANKLESNFTNELPALEKLPPALKTKPATGNLGERKAAIANAQEQSVAIHSKVAEIQQKTGMSFEDAFNAARKECPQLFTENK
jgi:hypothetical protein